MNPEQNLEAFLKEVAIRDTRRSVSQSYVFPGNDVGERLISEIEKKTGCQPSPALPPHSTELLLSTRFVSAEPSKFVSDTMQRITEVIAGLQHESAKTFALLFVNSSPSGWDDQVQIRVRFAV